MPILAAIVPTLENGGISRDGLTITYHLRHNVRWQDGAPFTSHDVSFSYRAIMNPATTVSTRHGYDQIARVDTPDPLHRRLPAEAPVLAGRAHVLRTQRRAVFHPTGAPARALPRLEPRFVQRQARRHGPVQGRAVAARRPRRVRRERRLLLGQAEVAADHRIVRPRREYDRQPDARARGRLVLRRDAARVSPAHGHRRRRRAARTDERERLHPLQHQARARTTTPTCAGRSGWRSTRRCWFAR